MGSKNQSQYFWSRRNSKLHKQNQNRGSHVSLQYFKNGIPSNLIFSELAGFPAADILCLKRRMLSVKADAKWLWKSSRKPNCEWVIVVHLQNYE